MLAGALAAAGATALALGWSPPAPVSADLNLTPSPSPTCSLPPPLTCGVPSPPPVVGSSPTPAAAPSPQGGSAPPPPASGSAPPPAPAGGGGGAGSTGGLSAADVQVLQSTLGNAALVQQLVAILQNPTAAERPDLLHFELAARSLAALRGKNGGGALLPVVILVLALAVAWMAAVPLLRLRARPVAVLAALAPAVLAGSLVVPALIPKPAAALHVQPRRLETKPAAWVHLVAIEQRLAADRRSLLFTETRLERLTAGLESQQQPVARVQPHVFSALAAIHGSEATAYDRDLQSEYELYLSAARQPELSQQLREGAAVSGQALPERAVAANLQTVATQLQQEAAIAQAQARLQQLGFTPAQAEALKSHDGFIAPVGGPIGQPFGPTDFAQEPPLQYGGHFYPHFHTGIDIEATQGTPVVAAADGVVALVTTSTDGHGHTTGYGTYIVVAHAHGYYTLYGHLSGVLVSAGQLVHQGQPIGLVGTTGNSTGPHLHFEIRLNGQFLDPLPYVTGRLRPW